MVEEIYLLGGGEQELYEELDRMILNKAGNKNIFAINLTTPDIEKLEEKKLALRDYFVKIGADKIEFASDCTDDEIREKMNQAGVLFICGGDTEYLLESIKKRELAESIKSFSGIIEGNSAGAYACCKQYVKFKLSRLLEGLGLVDIIIKAHYKPEFDEILNKLSEDKIIYGISEGAWIMHDGKLNFNGEVYKFDNDKKTRVEEELEDEAEKITEKEIKVKKKKEKKIVYEEKSPEAENAKEEIQEIVEKCVRCGLCKSLCPVFRIVREESVSPRGKAILLDKKVYDKIVYECSLCKACEERCPLGLKLCTAFKKARVVLCEEGKETEENKEMIRNIRDAGNPFGKEVKKNGKLYCC